MTLFEKDLQPPQEDAGDRAYSMVRAVLGGVPVLGSAAVELLQYIVQPPLARRQQEWMEELANDVRSLKTQRGIASEELRDNPAFIDAVLSATPAAMRTSQETKRRALRNAVLNSALPGAPEVAVQQMFIALLDRFTEWHLRVLKVFQNPQEWREKGGMSFREGSLASLLVQACPALRGRQDFYDQVWSDLNAAGFIGSPSLREMMPPNGAMSRRTTDFGDAFLAFIEDPFDR